MLGSLASVARNARHASGATGRQFNMLEFALMTDSLGYAAAVLTTGSFVPQAILTLRTRDVSGISLAMYASFTLGVALWLAYGISIGQWPIVVANIVTLILASVILAVKIASLRRPHSTQAP
jgi:MtN3 and saliva related transmembrane protein